jgi:hypothetical protein
MTNWLWFEIVKVDVTSESLSKTRRPGNETSSASSKIGHASLTSSRCPTHRCTRGLSVSEDCSVSLSVIHIIGGLYTLRFEWKFLIDRAVHLLSLMISRTRREARNPT